MTRRSQVQILPARNAPQKRALTRFFGTVGEAEIPEPRMPASVAEVEALSWREMKFIVAIPYGQAIRAFVDQGEGTSQSELERWEPEARATVARALPDVA
jgi:hypothetical protein